MGGRPGQSPPRLSALGPSVRLGTPDQLLLGQCWWLGLTAALACRGTLGIRLRLADVLVNLSRVHGAAREASRGGCKEGRVLPRPSQFRIRAMPTSQAELGTSRNDRAHQAMQGVHAVQTPLFIYRYASQHVSRNQPTQPTKPRLHGLYDVVSNLGSNWGLARYSRSDRYRNRYSPAESRRRHTIVR